MPSPQAVCTATKAAGSVPAEVSADRSRFRQAFTLATPLNLVSSNGTHVVIGL